MVVSVVGAYVVARMRASGRIENTDANKLWDAINAYSAQQADEIRALRAEVAAAHVEMGTLRVEVARMRAETDKQRTDAIKSRATARRCESEIAELKSLLVEARKRVR